MQPCVWTGCAQARDPPRHLCARVPTSLPHHSAPSPPGPILSLWAQAPGTCDPGGRCDFFPSLGGSPTPPPPSILRPQSLWLEGGGGGGLCLPLVSAPSWGLSPSPLLSLPTSHSLLLPLLSLSCSPLFIDSQAREDQRGLYVFCPCTCHPSTPARRHYLPSPRVGLRLGWAAGKGTWDEGTAKGPGGLSDRAPSLLKTSHLDGINPRCLPCCPAGLLPGPSFSDLPEASSCHCLIC